MRAVSASNLPQRGAAEQARRPDEQDEEDHPERDRELEIVVDVVAEQVDADAERETADDRSTGAVDPSERRARERVQQDRLHEVLVEARSSVDHAGDRTERGGKTPAEGEHPADAYADKSTRLRVQRRRAQPEAELRE